MADIKGIELASDIYGLEDTEGRTATQTAQNTATAASDKADSNETAIETIQSLIPSTATSANKLATENDIPDISLSEPITIISEGITFDIQKSGKTCMLLFGGNFSGASGKSFQFSQTIPAGFRPSLKVRSVIFENSTDIPYGQMTILTDGTITFWGGDGDIQSGQSYTGSCTFLAE